MLFRFIEIKDDEEYQNGNMLCATYEKEADTLIRAIKAVDKVFIEDCYFSVEEIVFCPEIKNLEKCIDVYVRMP